MGKVTCAVTIMVWLNKSQSYHRRVDVLHRLVVSFSLFLPICACACGCLFYFVQGLLAFLSRVPHSLIPPFIIVFIIISIICDPLDAPSPPPLFIVLIHFPPRCNIFAKIYSFHSSWILDPLNQTNDSLMIT